MSLCVLRVGKIKDFPLFLCGCGRARYIQNDRPRTPIIQQHATAFVLTYTIRNRPDSLAIDMGFFRWENRQHPLSFRILGDIEPQFPFGAPAQDGQLRWRLWELAMGTSRQGSGWFSGHGCGSRL